MDNVALLVVTGLSEQERLDAFPMPDEGPMWRRVRNQRDCNLVCGKCLRVVGESLTLLDVLTFTKHTGRYLIRCSCGAHVQVPAQHGVGRFDLMVEGPDGPKLNPALVKYGSRAPRRLEPRLPRPRV